MANEKHLEILRKGVEVWNQWREDNPDIEPDLRSAFLSDANLSDANLEGANLSDAFLSDATLQRANLNRANLSDATLYRAFLSDAFLSDATLQRANLNRANLSDANLTGVNLKSANLNGAFLSGANLNRANLKSANLKGFNLYRTFLDDANLKSANLEDANLDNANLDNANLDGANLRKVQALGAYFKGASLTGACLQDWNINSQTNLQDVECDFIYLKEIYSQEEQKLIFGDRRPHNGNFKEGEFTQLFQKALETVDLIFSEGIEWTAFLESFQKLRDEIKSEELSIQAIEKKSGGAFVVRLEVPQEANKAEIEKYIKQEYDAKLKVIDEIHRTELNAKDEQIAIYREQNTNLNEIVKLLANKPINIQNSVENRNNHLEKGNYNQNIEGDYHQS